MSDNRALHRGRGGLLGLSERVGSAPTRLAGGGSGGGRGGRPRTGRLQGRRADLPVGYREPHYAEMAVLAPPAGVDLEEAAGQQLLHVTGQVTFGDEATWRPSLPRCRVVGAPVEPLSLQAAGADSPASSSRGPCSWNRTRASWRPTPCLRALIETGGFALHCDTTVTSLEPDSPTSSRSGRADGRSLRPTSSSTAPAPLRSGSSTTPSGADASFAPPRSPTSRRETNPCRRCSSNGARHALRSPGSRAWGPCRDLQDLPPLAGHEARRLRPVRSDPTGIDDPAPGPADRRVARLLPSLDPQPVATERCVYDNAADSDFVLDRVGRIVVGCGTSGHAFKFGPLLGELLADLAEGRRPPVELGRFSLRRSPAARKGGGGTPVGCVHAPLRGPAPERQCRRPRPRRHGRAPRLVRRTGPPRCHDLHPDRQRPLHDGSEERGGHRDGDRATPGRGLRGLPGRPPPHCCRTATRRVLQSVCQSGCGPGRAIM